MAKCYLENDLHYTNSQAMVCRNGMEVSFGSMKSCVGFLT